MAETDAKKTSLEKLEQVMNSVAESELLNLLALKENMKQLINSRNSIKAIQLQAKKEEYAAFRRNQDGDQHLDSDQLKEMQVNLGEEADQLHKALLTHKLYKTTLQNSAFESQVQTNFFRCLKKGSEDVIRPEIRSTLEDYNENLSVSSKLAKEVDKTEGLEKEILQLKRKYRTLLASIRDKWEHLNNLHGKGTVHDYPSDHPELKELEAKVTKRREKLELLINLLQSLISCTGERWGANVALVEIMLLCDSALRQLEGNEEIDEGIKKLRLAKEQEKNASVKEIEAFVSSTPRKLIN